jgi:hypothetical protein
MLWVVLELLSRGMVFATVKDETAFGSAALLPGCTVYSLMLTPVQIPVQRRGLDRNTKCILRQWWIQSFVVRAMKVVRSTPSLCAIPH